LEVLESNKRQRILIRRLIGQFLYHFPGRRGDGERRDLCEGRVDIAEIIIEWSFLVPGRPPACAQTKTRDNRKGGADGGE
jgi:hypothetical protein